MSDLELLLRAFAKALILPPASPLFVALAGLALWRRAPRAGPVLAWAGVSTLLLLSMPVVAWLLTAAFDRAPLDLTEARSAQAIVILGGGTRRAAPEYGGDTMNFRTLERVRYGARVARETTLPVLVTGGRLFGATRSEAQLMAEALRDEYGVEVRWQEGASRNTHENAQFSGRVLRDAGVSQVVLVAHAIDMPRAMAEFAEAGITTIPAATGLASGGELAVGDFLPSIGALAASRDALYEMLGYLLLLARP